MRCDVPPTYHFLSFLSEGEAEVALPASRVLSSQIAGYDGREVNTNEMVEVIFPLNVRMCMLCATCHTCGCSS